MRARSASTTPRAASSIPRRGSRRQRERLRELAARLAALLARGTSAQRRTSLDASQVRLLRELRAPLPQAARLALAAAIAGARWARPRSRARRGGSARSAQSLAHLNPQAVLERGYAIVATAQGEIVVDSAQLQPATRSR